MTKESSLRTATQVLATDLDGTLIPLDGDVGNREDLTLLARELRAHGIQLVFVTGRHFASVMNAINEFHLPVPDWILCDVGTSVFQRCQSGNFRSIGDYDEHLQQIISTMPMNALRELLEPIPGLRLQESEKQGRFKLSFYVGKSELDRLVERIELELDRMVAPYSIIHSVDPFNGDGLIDLVPLTVSKAHALEWWCEHTQLGPDSIVFAGDSGNDLAVLTAGHRAIVVANASQEVVRQACTAHHAAGWKKRLYIARSKATSGVLEGCRWFQLIDSG